MPERNPRKKGLPISPQHHLRPPRSINTYFPIEILREIFLYSIEVNQANAGDLASVCRYWRSVTHPPRSINTDLPMEILREIFLYSIEANQVNTGDLASVCRHWRSVTITLPSLWSTLKVGISTERERVATWLQRGYPPKIIIDTERDDQGPSNTPRFAALQDALASTAKWHELTISSFPAEDLVSQLDLRAANPMNLLKSLHVAAGCMPTASLTQLLGLIPAHESSLCELRLFPSFVTAYFLQPHWLPALQNLTVLIVNGRDVHDPFKLLPAFTQLRVFEAECLPLPWYEPNANLPLLHTLQKLRLRASSVQWMAGREFLSLGECAILLPHDWSAVEQLRVELPCCQKMTYHGYPMTIAQYFHAPQMKGLGLGSHDIDKQRVYQQLQHLCRSNVCVSKLTSLHLTLQCCQKRLVNVLKYMESLEELVLCITYPSSLGNFLLSLAAGPSSKDWPTWYLYSDHEREWTAWCSSQTWHTNILPSLKYLSIQSTNGLSRSQCLDILPILRLVAWTRSQSSVPLEHLKVWESRGAKNDTMTDYLSTGCLQRHFGWHFGWSSEVCDSMIVRGMVTQCLVIRDSVLSKKLHSTVLFKRLQVLDIYDAESHILPYLDQIKELTIRRGIPAYSLDVDLPLVHTLQILRLYSSPFSWTVGRLFKVLKECFLQYQKDTNEDLVRFEGMQVNMPACETLRCYRCLLDYIFFISCPNLQILDWVLTEDAYVPDRTVLKLHDFLLNCPHLQNLSISISRSSAPDALIDLVFCGAWEQKLWQVIRSVLVEVQCYDKTDANQFATQMVGQKRYYEKWWNVWTVSKGEFLPHCIDLSASM